MKRAGFIAILATAALLMAGTAQCAPSFRGYTGLVVIPTADTLNNGEYNFGAMTEDVSDFDANDLFANFAPTNNLEVGFNSYLANHDGERETLLNAKYRLMPETHDRAAVAFGIIDATDEINTTAYAVVSKTLAQTASAFDSEMTGIRGHIGIAGGGFNNEQLSGLFMGVSAFLGNRVMLSAEWDSEDVNLGFRFTPVRGVRLHAAWFDLGGSDDLGIGASFTKSY